MATDEGKCRKQLNYLIDQVSALSISSAQICWQVSKQQFLTFPFSDNKKLRLVLLYCSAHHAFRECMLTATDRNCRGSSGSSAIQFTRDMFSKSLAFLVKQCDSYVSVTCFPWATRKSLSQQK